jgi:hypothetical protein
MVIGIGVPVLVIMAANLGLEPTHWFGTSLSHVELTGGTTIGPIAPEPAKVLLGSAELQENGNSRDLAPSYWDPDTGRVMLGAVTDEGVRLRESLGRSNTSGAPYQVVRLKHSTFDLRALQDFVVEHGGDYWTVVSAGVDAQHNRVELTVRRLDHSTLAAMGRYHGEAAVRLTPFALFAANVAARTDADAVPGASPLADPVALPTLRYADPVGTWFTLLTGFPLYLGGVLAVLAAWWVVAIRRHLRRHPEATPASEATTA